MERGEASGLLLKPTGPIPGIIIAQSSIILLRAKGVTEGMANVEKGD